MNKWTQVLLSTLMAILPLKILAQVEQAPTLPAAASRSYAQNYKDSALVFCIAKAYKEYPELANDAYHSAGALDVWGQYDLQNSTGKIPALVDQYLSRTYSSKHVAGTRLDLLKCIDMYHGLELEALSKQYVIDPERSFKDDNPEYDLKQ